MGCDYYIIKQLRIEHSDGIDTIELDRKGCYFNYEICSDIDSDDTDYIPSYSDGEKLKKYERYLKVTYKPRTLLEDCEWKNDIIRDKYIEMVYEKLKNYNNAFHNINLIIKEEVRYFR